MEILETLDGYNETVWFERFVSDLSEKDYSVHPGALPPGVLVELRDKLEALSYSDFDTAHVGRRRDEQRNSFVRSNRVHWLLDDDHSITGWHRWTHSLKKYLNRHLLLGLESFESHLALYEPGSFYKRHLDVFKGERNRVVSLVTYLNDGWQPDQGGELVLYSSRREPLKISPESGTVVLFLSESVPHEVLTTQRTRHSVAGWFRVRSSVSLLDLPRYKV